MYQGSKGTAGYCHISILVDMNMKGFRCYTWTLLLREYADGPEMGSSIEEGH